MAENLKVCIIGAEGWGTAIAATISKNVMNLREGFNGRVHIYVYDDPMHNSRLSDVINNRHENIKYLPGIKLPKNLIAVNDLLEATQNADILIFSIPHNFVKTYCNILAGNVKETAFAVSMVRGLMQERDDEMGLVSETISEKLDIPCYSMMSAHSSMEMAQGKLCEITVGCDDAEDAQLLTAVLQTNNCRVICIDDVTGVELCGTLNEIISLGAGFVDGLNLGDNTRVAAIHLSVKEMMRFIKTFFPSTKMSTFYETCGIANSVAATYVDKNVNFAQSFITTGKTFEEMESSFMHGRKLLGPLVAAEVNAFLKKALMQHEFPLFTAIHRISQNEAPPEIMLDALRNHPDLSNSSIAHLLSTETSPIQERMDHVLDQVADALPKLRSCLDRILVQANSPNFKNLKVMDDWAQVDEYKVENFGLPVSSANNPIETGDISSRLSAEASRIRDEIQKGNVQVGFKMDANEGGRHLRLLLNEEPEKCTTESEVPSGLGKGELVQEYYLDSSTECTANKGIPPDNTMNDTVDVFNLNNEDTRVSNEARLKVQDNLIKSIRQTIEALGNKEKMDSLIAESKMEDENSPFARFNDHENQSQDEATEVNVATEAAKEHMLSDSDEQSLLREQENPVELRLHDDVEATLDEVPVLDERDHTNDMTELEELQLWQKLKMEPEKDSPKLSEVQDHVARDTISKHGKSSDVDEQRPVTMGNRKPIQTLNKVNVRHFRNKKSGDDGHHEWDWMLNHKIDTDETSAHEKDETLSTSDKEGLDSLNIQLQKALQRDFDLMSSSGEMDQKIEPTSHYGEMDQEIGRTSHYGDLDQELGQVKDDKGVTHEPNTPLPLKLPIPKKHYREGTPQIQNQPGTFPPPMRKSKTHKPKKMQPYPSNPPVEFGELPETKQPEAILDQPEPEAKAKPTSTPPSKEKSEPARPAPKRVPASKPSETRKTSSHSDKLGEVQEDKPNQKSQVSKTDKKLTSVLRKGKQRQVDYRGQNPFGQDPDLESKLTLDTSNDRDMGREGLSHQRRKVVVSPPFNPPLNPRVRVPRPPFDVRDHEYHTMVARPVINPLASAIKWPSSTKTLKPPAVSSTIQMKQLVTLPIKVPRASRSLLQISWGMPRNHTLTKILCALQIGLLASYFACSKKN